MEQRREEGNTKSQIQENKPKSATKFSDPSFEQNSLSSLGSLPDAPSVEKHFQNDNDSFHRMTIHSNRSTTGQTGQLLLSKSVFLHVFYGALSVPIATKKIC